MSKISDFIIEDGVLKEYLGSDATVVIPDEVKVIGYNAFYMCGTLVHIKIGNSVTAIEDDAFYRCTALETLEMGNNIISIGKGAFGSCRSLAEINLSTTLTSIDEKAFSDCVSIKEISLPDSVTYIGAEAFSMCESLECVKLPQFLTEISTKTFNNCEALRDIVIPESVTQIGSQAFRKCKLLPLNFRIYNYTTRMGMIVNYEDATVPVANGVDKGELYHSLKDFKFIVENKHIYLGNAENPYLVFCGHEDGDNGQVCLDININSRTKYLDIFLTAATLHGQCILEKYHILKLRWLNENFASVPAKLKIRCVESFLEAYFNDEAISESVKAAYHKYINSQRKKYYLTLSKNPLLFKYMIITSMITKDACDDILKEFKKTKKDDMLADMLAYMDKNGFSANKKGSKGTKQ